MIQNEVSRNELVGRIEAWDSNSVKYSEVSVIMLLQDRRLLSPAWNFLRVLSNYKFVIAIILEYAQIVQFHAGELSMPKLDCFSCYWTQNTPQEKPKECPVLHAFPESFFFFIFISQRVSLLSLGLHLNFCNLLFNLSSVFILPLIKLAE